ncbi:unnamed protein product [Cylindrotheca closterium]|uniref:Uncharacterized protein n=1 Tax=Cylindrotheca closterium TaxID=2856 RepID=A0AAD2CJ85_9STRA|nr:unnamed protein product [Cylindrotheca closterium]
MSRQQQYKANNSIMAHQWHHDFRMCFFFFFLVLVLMTALSNTIFASAFSPTKAMRAEHTSFANHHHHHHHHLESAIPSRRPTSTTQLLANQEQQGDFQQEAQELLAKAQKLREEINQSKPEDSSPATSERQETTALKQQSKWSVNYKNASSDASNIDNTAESLLKSQTYRLYLDVGREEGTWMDPRWGASGRRIEGTLDVCFSSQKATPEMEAKMVSDNQMGASSPCFTVHTANKARLRSGFDEMDVTEPHQGGYRVDGLSSSRRKSQTLRFYVTVNGMEDGDVSIPKGRLYFSLPCFLQSSSGNNPTSPPQIMLSNKEGIISVRQIGWHTGWRREESRILGVFRAVPIEKAHRVDGY